MKKRYAQPFRPILLIQKKEKFLIKLLYWVRDVRVLSIQLINLIFYYTTTACLFSFFDKVIFVHIVTEKSKRGCFIIFFLKGALIAPPQCNIPLRCPRSKVTRFNCCECFATGGRMNLSPTRDCKTINASVEQLGIVHPTNSKIWPRTQKKKKVIKWN